MIATGGMQSFEIFFCPVLCVDTTALSSGINAEYGRPISSHIPSFPSTLFCNRYYQLEAQWGKTYCIESYSHPSKDGLLRCDLTGIFCPISLYSQSLFSLHTPS
eukprot:TRINITY_DN125_c0_g1_i10.p3 TRINITY_DN125_c0_g1~~TRINITY_DN125_c0_g1_i10.p3  ORF type:complete len:104 (-),score=5.43 TRINITY_DN125_c0_g1_i10:218-529(-)